MDEVVFGVGPVQLLLAVVQRQPVGPVDLSVDDHGAIGPVHPRTLDLWDLAPVGPVHVPEDTHTNTSVPEDSHTGVIYHRSISKLLFSLLYISNCFKVKLD